MTAGGVLRVDWIRCDGYGLCGDLLPELIDLDDWRYPILRGEGARGDGVPGDLMHVAQRAVDCCPMKALALTSRADVAIGTGGRSLAGTRS